jgi:hypothetical protein
MNISFINLVVMVISVLLLNIFCKHTLLKIIRHIESVTLKNGDHPQVVSTFSDFLGHVASQLFTNSLVLLLLCFLFLLYPDTTEILQNIVLATVCAYFMALVGFLGVLLHVWKRPHTYRGWYLHFVRKELPSIED